MRALTLTQPWAGIVASGIKPLGPVVLAGHAMSYTSIGEFTVSRRAPPGGLRVACSCGWVRSEPADTKRAARVAYRSDHLNPLREAARTTCRVCCDVKLPGEMSAGKEAGNICKRCVTAKSKAWAAQHPKEWDRQRWGHHLRKKFGLTIERYDEMLVNQGGRCAICRLLSTESPRRFHVDHDHVTGIVRGLLCYRCNTGIGVFRDDVVHLRSAIKYLQESSR